MGQDAGNLRTRATAFLSHASVDSVIALELAALLEAHGVKCWIAPRDVAPGEPYASECVRGIEGSSAFILLATSSAIGSVQVLSEVEQAHKRKKPILTVLIGKPRISSELDYYISRLHWVEYAGGSLQNVAGRLASVLEGAREWESVSSPPSLRRRLVYGRELFFISIAAVALAMTVLGAGGYYWVSHQLNRDFRRIGYLTFGAQRASEPGPVSELLMQGQVWLLARDAAFGDIHLTTISQTEEGRTERKDYPGSMFTDAAGPVQEVELRAPASTQRLTSCLDAPQPRTGERYRVIQIFSIRMAKNSGGAITISPISEPRVAKEKGSVCN